MLENIHSVIQKALLQVNGYLQESLSSNSQPFQALITPLLQQEGKQIRPQLTLLFAGILGNELTEKARRGAALVSLLHQASLIHDDVIDQARIRRYIVTVNAEWGNKIAVLLGDYVLASMLRMITVNKDYAYMDMLVTTAQTMAEGEIMQLQQISGSGCQEAVYLQIIQKKTASLIAASCALGALAVNASIEQIDMAYQIGEHVGMAFQLADDLLDYDRSAHSGKLAFMDLKSQQLTLPLIYSLQQASAAESQHIIKIIQDLNREAELPDVLNFINQWGGIAYTQEKISFYHQQALDLIDTSLPPSDYTISLTSFVNKLLLSG